MGDNASTPTKPRSTRPDARWLDATEQATWQAFLESTRAVFAALESQLQNDAGMPLGYYSILVTLSEAPERTLRMGELAAKLHSSASRISHAMNRMEASGWVRRESHPTDRRAQFAVLTDEGLSVLTAAAPQHVAAVRRHLFNPLTADEVKQLGVISRAICTSTVNGAELPK